MINVSNEFRQLMNRRTDFKEYAEITFADGTFLELSAKDFTVTNNGVVDAAGSNGIPLGVALCRNIQIELMNDDNRFSTYDFANAVIRLYLTFQLSETEERIEYGTFTVLTPETYGETVIVTALDDMYKADKLYDSTLVYPATLGLIFADACNNADIQPGTTTFLNDDFVVNTKPTDITYRQLFGYIAMIAGGNARIDTTGRLRIVTYDFARIDELYSSIYDGGRYNPWNNSVNLDGGTFNPWNEGDVADGGTFGDRNDIHVLGNWSSLKVDTDDVVITGISTVYSDSDNNELTAMYGAEGYVLQVENPLIVGQEQSAVNLIGNVMVGGKFRQFSGDMVSDPTCEFMDIALVLDRKGNVYISFLTDINFQFFGFTSLKNSAEPTLRNSSRYYSEATQTLVAARKLIQKERTAREVAVAQLAKDLANSSGLFSTQEEQADGSIIYYMHDKPTLAESMIIWKLTTLAFGISTDGGKTYPYGFTVDGEEIIRLLYAEGIDVKNLVVGENVKMGKNATIAWENVENQPDFTQITKDTVTTEYVNALGVKASELEAGTSRKLVVNTADCIAIYEDGEMIWQVLTDGKGIATISFLKTDASGSTTSLGSRICSIPDLIINDSFGCNSFASFFNGCEVYGGLVSRADFLCTGTKSRLASTENYNDRLLYCYEMPTPYFGDIGEGQLDESGICYVYIDDIFLETIDTGCKYQVFLQKYGEGEIVVSERNGNYFVVTGTPGLSFAWEIKAKQAGYTMERLDEFTESAEEETVNYEAEATAYLSEYERSILNYA